MWARKEPSGFAPRKGSCSSTKYRGGEETAAAPASAERKSRDARGKEGGAFYQGPLKEGGAGANYLSVGQI